MIDPTGLIDTQIELDNGIIYDSGEGFLQKNIPTPQIDFEDPNFDWSSIDFKQDTEFEFYGGRYTIIPGKDGKIKLTQQEMAMISAGMDFIPLLGDAKGFGESIAGYSFDGEKLNNWQKLSGFLLLGEIKHLDKLVGIAKSSDVLEAIDIVLKYKDDWNDVQCAAADLKVQALTEAFTRKTVVGPRKSTANIFRKSNSLEQNVEVDHLIDLQLGGLDILENMWSLDKSVNRSLGAQIYQALKDVPAGTVIENFKIE
ncbi:hypothetical protein [Spirochaeta cellobiosiphila]|uniref:hypothetical protein n=1 Tax=Spirochaeta cellobiosiphila TaxID=504483 RepID=UPI0004118BF5|nr:hypothetical protein [Spirochaeta cellobiosiphila]